MAHDAVQDLLDKVWFGGLEPVTSSLTVSCKIFNNYNKSLNSDLKKFFQIGLCCLLPILVPWLMTASKDKMIDRISWLKSGLFYSGNAEPSKIPHSPEEEPSKVRKNVLTLTVFAHFCSKIILTISVANDHVFRPFTLILLCH